jgi:hypothetical protein
MRRRPTNLASEQRTVWYLQHGDIRKDNPDGLAMAEISLP